MLTINCPRCSEAVRVPHGELPDDAFAQCPWCRETFPIAEVVHQLPPVVQIISADGEVLDLGSMPSPMIHSSAKGTQEPVPIFDRDADLDPSSDGHDEYDTDLTELVEQTTAADDNKTVSEETVAETWVDRSTRVDETRASESDFVVQDPNQGWDESDLPGEGPDEIAPMRVSPAPVTARKPRPKTSGLRTMISVVLGGAVAFPLAIGILWVLTLFGVQVDLGFWPLNGNSSTGSNDVVAATPNRNIGRPDQGASGAGRPLGTGRSLGSSQLEYSDDQSGDGGPEIGSDQSPAEQALAEIAEETLGPGGSGLLASGDGASGDGGVDPLTPDAAPKRSSPPSADEIEPMSVSAGAPQASGTGLTLPIEGNGFAAEAPTARGDSPSGPAAKIGTGDIAIVPSAGDETMAAGGPSVGDAAGSGKGETSASGTTEDSTTPIVVDSPEIQNGSVDNGTIALTMPEGGPSPDQSAADSNQASPPSESSVDASTARPEAAIARGDQPVTVIPEPEKNDTGVARVDETDPSETTLPNLNDVPEPKALVAAVDEAFKWIDALENMNRGDAKLTKTALAKAYVAIALVGELAQEESESVRKLLATVRDSDDLKTWSAAAPDWLDYGEQRPNEGILFVGQARDFGDGPVVAINGDKIVPLTNSSKPLNDRANVIGLGRIVSSGSEPALELIATEPQP